MPLLSLQTNIQLNTEQQQEFLLLASKTMAEILGKPESYVMVSVQANIAMSFAASTEACAYIEFKSLGLVESDTAKFSKSIGDLVQTRLGINPARIYIEFANPERHLWGWNQKTF